MDEESKTSGPLRRGFHPTGLDAGRLFAIVEELAKEPAPYDRDGCVFCGTMIEPDVLLRHAADCLWRRAVEATR